MKIYDISQPLFECAVFPGDPSPKKEVLMLVSEGAVCNLSAFSMCAHNGTHVDAPYHFYENGKTLKEMPLEIWIGEAYVTEHDGDVFAEDARKIMEKAKSVSAECAERILIKGKAVVTNEAAEVFAQANIKLIGNESQTVGPENAPRQVHLTLLGRNIGLLEGIRLSEVPEGAYILNAAPLNLGEADGAPCRAVLIEL